MPTEAGFVEHQIRHERRTREMRPVAQTTRWVTQWRWSCACGFATQWTPEMHAGRRAVDRHALNGQLSIGW